MKHRAREAITNPSSAAGFRALDLNQPVASKVELLVDLEQWRACETHDLPPREGACYLGIDLGGSASLSAAVATWDTGRTEAWVAVSAVPSLLDRGRADGVGALYEQAHEDGFLSVTGEHIVDVRRFLAGVLAEVPADAVIGCDRYRRRPSLLDVLAGLESPGRKHPVARRRCVRHG